MICTARIMHGVADLDYATRPEMWGRGFDYDSEL